MHHSYAFLQNRRSAFAVMKVDLDNGQAGYSHLGLLRPFRFHARLLLLSTAYHEGNLAEMVEGPVVEACQGSRLRLRDLNDYEVF